MQKLFSLIIPCYNEEEVIELSINTIIESLKNLEEKYELIFVNDGSKDNTLNILKNLAKNNKNIKIISFSRNFGQQAALRAGLEHASGDYIGFIDADLQDPPTLLPQMIAKIKEGYDIVYGQRTKRNGETKFKLLTASLYYKFSNFLCDIKIPQNVSDFRVITRQVANEILRLKEQNQSLRAMMAFVGFSQIGIDFERPERAAGETKYTLKKMLKLAEDGLIGFSTKPLKAPLIISFITAVLTALFAVLAIFGVYFTSTFLTILNSLYFSILFFALGIIGMYLIKIYENTKNRPLYIVKELVNFNKEE